jgi:hypothetical protein
MTRLPYDVARCQRTDCPRSQDCLRFTDKGHPTRQVFNMFEPEGCTSFIQDDRAIAAAEVAAEGETR